MDIRKARKERGITQQELAKRIGVNRATVSKYESGQISIPFAQVLAIAEALDMTLYDLSPEFPEQHKEIMSASFEAGYFAREEEDRLDGYTFSDEEIMLIKHFSSLNTGGQHEAIKRVHELTRLDEYKRIEQPETPAEPLAEDEQGKSSTEQEKPPAGQTSPNDGK